MKSRRLSQFVSLLALHSSWGPEFKWLCNPVLSCHSCALAWFACPIGVFIHYAGFQTFPFLAAGMVLLLGVLLGRLLCGWVCPFGFVQDLLHMVPTPKFTLPAWTGKTKYVVLIATVILLPAVYGGETLLSFCRVCPASALQVTIPNQIANGFTTMTTLTIVKLVLLALVLGLAVFSSRAFCKVFCPIGAMLAPLNLVAFWRMKAPTKHCALCHKCDNICPVHGAPSSRVAQGIAANDATECIVCHDCQAVCPHKDDVEPQELDFDDEDRKDWETVVNVVDRLAARKDGAK